MHTVRNVHSRCFSLLLLRALCIFSISLQSHFCASGFFGAPVSVTGAGGAGVAGSLLPGDSAPGVCQLALSVVDIHARVLRVVSNNNNNNNNNKASISSVPLFASHLWKWTQAGSPSQELPSVGGGDDCVLLGGMSSSRSPRPLPRTPTTQLHGDRLWQGPGERRAS